MATHMVPGVSYVCALGLCVIEHKLIIKIIVVLQRNMCSVDAMGPVVNVLIIKVSGLYHYFNTYATPTFITVLSLMYSCFK